MLRGEEVERCLAIKYVREVRVLLGFVGLFLVGRASVNEATCGR